MALPSGKGGNDFVYLHVKARLAASVTKPPYNVVLVEHAAARIDDILSRSFVPHCVHCTFANCIQSENRWKCLLLCRYSRCSAYGFELRIDHLKRKHVKVCAQFLQRQVELVSQISGITNK